MRKNIHLHVAYYNVAGGLLLSLSSNNNPQNVAADLLLSISGNEYPSKRRRRPPLIPLRRHKPLKTSPQGAEGTAIRQCDIYFDFILNCFNLGVDG